MRFGSRTLTLATLLLGAFFASPANAISIIAGNIPGGDNVISSNFCTSTVQGPASIIDGCLNSSPSLDVRFEAHENIYFDAGGQAVILPQDNLGFNFLQISIVGNSFDYLLLNIHAVNDGFVTFESNLGVHGNFALDGNGQNFFTIFDDTFSWISLTSPDTEFKDVEQVRLDCLGTGCDVNEVPEPATLALFGAGLAGVAIIRRRRKAKA